VCTTHRDVGGLPQCLTRPSSPGTTKAWFYLDHRHDIESWAALRADAPQLLDNHLVKITDRVADLAEEVGAEVWSRDLDSGSCPTAGLRRPTVAAPRHGGRDRRHPVERSKLLTPGSNDWPYVAVRLPADAIDEQRRREIRDAFKPVRDQLKGTASPSYQFWRYVAVPGGAPVDPAALVDDLHTWLQQLWDAASPVLDALNSRGQDTAPR
jgi:hypothetical protein